MTYREISKCSGCVSEPCPQEQDPGDGVSGERRQAAGDHHLVRQFLRAAAARRAFAARLQARDLDGHAGAADPAVRGRQGARRSSEPTAAPRSQARRPAARLVIHPACKLAAAQRPEAPGARSRRGSTRRWGWRGRSSSMSSAPRSCASRGRCRRRCSAAAQVETPARGHRRQCDRARRRRRGAERRCSSAISSGAGRPR